MDIRSEVKFKSISIQSVLLVGILLLAALLRFYRFTEIPFTNDELSALVRLQFDSFGDLIKHGVIPDGHPAFTQVFLYYYCQLFGTTEWIVKLPFALCGMLSVYLAYKIASLFNSRNLGLLVSGFMATSQYFIFYSQLARPYSFGLLFVLLLMHTGLRIIIHHRRGMLNYFLFGLLLTLNALTHYFALLTAVLICFCFFIAEGKEGKKFLIYSVAGALALYLPHLSVFFSQLQTGGVGGSAGWLAKPDSSFPVHYLQYLFEYTSVIYFYAGVSVLICFYFILKAPAREIKLLSMGVFLFFGNLIIGYLYSIKVNPVLQYSVLLFSAPFLLTGLFYGISKWRQRYFVPALLLLLAGNIFGLVYSRSHYTLMYSQGYQACVKSVIAYPKAALYLDGNSRFYFDYYFRKQNVHPLYIDTKMDTLDAVTFKNELAHLKEDTLVIGYAVSGNPLYILLAKEFYPVEIYNESGASYETVVLCRNPADSSTSADSTQLKRGSLFFQTDQEFGPVQSLDIGPEHITPGLIIEVSTEISAFTGREINPLLVLVVEDEEQHPLGWYGVSLKELRTVEETSTTLHIVVRMEDITSLRRLRVKSFIWNKGHEQFESTFPEIRIQKGNGLLYGLIEDFRR